ncbi:MAG: hypothetical protein AVDCRST_MAG93-4525 [uncultured Chloroflexia bacterium]|uniref:Uncharacterized protein n=1 Tax=uncultured Chloroflexia bacterium TaxID=1672391 RepID=A0A6J4K9L1_9CHLR|nr:MAG: hypothetical protein AVDCRST_MAG93-4525 [uncultured Chloroflexia bacterium]
MLDGYRSVAEVPGEATAEARILWYHLAMAVWGLRFGPPRDGTWIANRLARLERQMQAFVAQSTTIAL